MRNPNLTRRISLVFAIGLLAAGAVAPQSTGVADFTRYVAIGDSLGAGFISGGMVDEVQEHSYPALIYKQVNGGSLAGFELPTASPPGIPPVLQLASLSPLLIVPATGQGAPTNLTLPQPYQNLSVPGATIDDVLNTRSGGLYDLVLRGFGTQLELALAQQPTFVTLWVNNDALSAATSGVVLEDVTLTSLAAFEAKYNAVVGTFFAAAEAAGTDPPLMALATIPDVTSIPFVTTIPPVLVNPATNEPVVVGGSLVPLIGPEGPLVPGQDFVLLSGSAELAAGRGIPLELGGSGQPLSDFAVLSGAEVAAINARIAEFNAVIEDVAELAFAALVDVNAIFADVAANGRNIGGIDFSADFLTGGLFSLDGVHPTPMGYAITANEFIAAINAQFGAAIPPVDLFPYVFGPFGSLSTGFPVQTEFVFTPKANRQLQKAMGNPSKARLARIKARRAGRQ